MTYEITDYFTMFWSSFLVVFLLGLQSKNVNQGRYIAAIVTSFGISVGQFLFVKYSAAGNLLAFSIMATGGCMGIAFSIWFYKHFMERKKHDSNTCAHSRPAAATAGLSAAR